MNISQSDQEPKFYIRKDAKDELFWSQDDGWVEDFAQATKLEKDETYLMNLSVGGEVVNVEDFINGV